MNIKKDINKMNYIKYVNRLFKRSKPVRKITTHYRILVISDLHGLLKKNFTVSDIDDYFILGDVSSSDLRILDTCIPLEKAYYLHGNHDNYNQYTKGTNLHNKYYFHKVRFAGFEGSIKYKDSSSPLYTHEESIELLDNQTFVDILFTHDRAFLNDNSDYAHCGLLGISKYLCDKKVPIHIHGHTHKNEIEILPNGTKSISIRGIAIVDINNDEISIEQIFDWQP